MIRTRWMVALVAGTGLAAVVFAAARPTGPESSPQGTPTDAEARTLLAQTYERAKQTADASAFCVGPYAGPQCISQYQEVGGRPAVPTEPPQIVESWVTDQTRVLTVCGVDGLGKTYRADFPVEYVKGAPGTFLDVFWNSKTYSGRKAPGEVVVASPHPQRFSC